MDDAYFVCDWDLVSVAVLVAGSVYDLVRTALAAVVVLATVLMLAALAALVCVTLVEYVEAGLIVIVDLDFVVALVLGVVSLVVGVV